MTPESEVAALKELTLALFAEKQKALEAALLAQEKAVTAALDSSDKAIEKAEINAERWRASANEWRGAMSDRDRELPSRREVDAAMSAVEGRLALVERLADTNGGRRDGERTKGSDINRSAGLAIAASGVGVAVVAVLAALLASQ